MVVRSVTLVAMAAALAAAAALAQDPAARSQNERLICRGGLKQLSSRIRTPRRCRTAEQWRQEEDAKGQLPLSAQITTGQNDGRQPTTPQ